MGWPRKNDGCRLYREKNGTYFMLVIKGAAGPHDAVANVYGGLSLSLGTTQISNNYLASTWPKRMQWDELPKAGNNDD